MQETKKDHAVMLERAQTHDDEPIKPIPVVTKVDYSGAHEKTDPREIALVRKLDKWIMPMLWSMYWLNYCFVSHHICVARAPESCVWACPQVTLHALPNTPQSAPKSIDTAAYA